MERLATEPGVIRTHSGEVGSQSRLVRVILERPVAAFCELDTATGGLEGQRPVVQLGEPQRLRIPTFLSNQELFIQDSSGDVEPGSGLPVLAEPIVVPAVAGIVVRGTDVVSAGTEPVAVLSGGATPAMPRRCASTLRVGVIRARLRNSGVPELATKFILASTRPTTQSTYQGAWGVWCGWCLRFGHDPLHNNLI